MKNKVHALVRVYYLPVDMYIPVNRDLSLSTYDQLTEWLQEHKDATKFSSAIVIETPGGQKVRDKLSFTRPLTTDELNEEFKVWRKQEKLPGDYDEIDMFSYENLTELQELWLNMWHERFDKAFNRELDAKLKDSEDNLYLVKDQRSC